MGYREAERQRSPECAQGVSQAVEQLSAENRSLASPLFLLLNEYLMEEKQDAELQAALRAANLSELLE